MPDDQNNTEQTIPTSKSRSSEADANSRLSDNIVGSQGIGVEGNLMEDDTMESEKNSYELAYLSKPFEEAEALGFEAEVSGIIAKYGGKISSISKINRTKIAYPIKSTNLANSQYIKFSVEADKIDKINNEMAFLNDLLRFVIVKSGKEGLKTRPFKKEVSVLRRRAFAARKEDKRIKPIERKIQKVKTIEEKKEKLDSVDLDKRLDEILENELLE